MSINEYQLLNKVLTDKNYNYISDNLLEKNNFVQTVNEYEFLKAYHKEYNDIPDKTTFVDKFPDFKLFQVDESVEAIVDRLREEDLFRKTVAVFNKTSELVSVDANKGCEYLRSAIKDLEPNYKVKYTDAVNNAQERYDNYMERVKGSNEDFVPLAYSEINESMYGMSKGSLTAFTARISQGKSQILVVCAEYAASLGLRVGFISPEMLSEQILYRMDTAKAHVSARGLFKGEPVVGYKEYIDRLKDSAYTFFVSDYDDFDNDITVQKVENYIKSLKLDILFIDDISYVRPTHSYKGASEEWTLGESTKEVLGLATKYNIPIAMTVQANRKATEDENKNPSLENIAGSDKIGRICTNVISLKQCGPAIEFYIAKSRFGKAGIKFIYTFDFDRLNFNFIPTLEGASEDKKEEVRAQNEEFKNLF